MAASLCPDKGSQASVLASDHGRVRRVVAEVGASMMVGGNLLGQTRVLTTATSMEVSKGILGCDSLKHYPGGNYLSHQCKSYPDSTAGLIPGFCGKADPRIQR